MNNGKWSQPGVPHRGWTCHGVTDLGEPMETCEMCEQQTIRYVHEMHHADYGVLHCGCVCAGHMEGDVVAARRREASAKRETARRLAWANTGWRPSKRGNPYRKKDGVCVTLFRRDGAWAYSIAAGDNVRFPTERYPTPSLAALAAYDDPCRTEIGQ